MTVLKQDWACACQVRPGPGAGRLGLAVVTGFSPVSGSRQRRRSQWAHRHVNRKDAVMLKTHVSRVAAGAIISAALRAGSLSLTATAASACSGSPQCNGGPPPPAVPA